MNQAEIEPRVIQIIAKQLSMPKEKVTRSAKIQDDLGADSLDTVEMVMELEDGLDIEIPDEALEKIKTVGDVVDYAEKTVKKA